MMDYGANTLNFEWNIQKKERKKNERKTMENERKF